MVEKAGATDTYQGALCDVASGAVSSSSKPSCAVLGHMINLSVPKVT